MKQDPHWGSINIRRHHTKFSHHSNLRPGFVYPWHRSFFCVLFSDAVSKRDEVTSVLNGWYECATLSDRNGRKPKSLVSYGKQWNTDFLLFYIHIIFSIAVLYSGDCLLYSGTVFRRLPILSWFFVQEITFSVVVLYSGDYLFCSGSMCRKLPVL